MKGGFLHNEVLLAPLEGYFRGLGAPVHREHPAESGRSPRAVDLFVTWGTRRIVIEAELTARRVLDDVAKAELLNATLLLVVVPTARIAEAARGRIAQADLTRTSMAIWVLPLGPALERVRRCFPFSSNPIQDRITTRGAEGERR